MDDPWISVGRCHRLSSLLAWKLFLLSSKNSPCVYARARALARDRREIKRSKRKPEEKTEYAVHTVPSSRKNVNSVIGTFRHWPLLLEYTVSHAPRATSSMPHAFCLLAAIGR